MKRCFLKLKFPLWIMCHPSLYIVPHRADLPKVEQLLPLGLVDGMKAAEADGTAPDCCPSTKPHLAVVAEVAALLTNHPTSSILNSRKRWQNWRALLQLENVVNFEKYVKCDMERWNGHPGSWSWASGGGGGGKGCCLSQDIFQVRSSNRNKRALFITAPISDAAGQLPSAYL